MKKIIASILAAFFVVLSPVSAYAATTTESMMLYSTLEDDYNIMPLDIASSNFNLSTYVGTYNRASEQFIWTHNDFTGLSNGSIVPPSDWFSGQHVAMSYNPNMMFAYGISIGSPDTRSPISIPDGSTLSIYLPSIRCYGWDSSAQKNIFLSNNLAVPYRVYADMHFTAMQQVGTTHSGTYHNQTVELTNFFTPSANMDGSCWFDLNLQIPVQADQSNLNENIDRLYNINLRYVKIYAVYDTSQFLYKTDDSKVNFSDGQNYNMTFEMRNLGSSNISSRIYVTYTGGNGNAELSSGLSGLQSSISALSSSVSNQVQQVKTQLTQSTNTITTRIDTMSTNIQQGLQNVVQSAQQNTQNIINTVTQKVDQVKETVTEVKDSILDLPNKIQEMLLGLIVPDSDTMADKYSEFSGLLEEKLGVIYQIPMMLFDFFDTIVNAATTPQSTLTLPAFRLPWIDGSQLTIWNSMEYKIIPDGLEVLSDLIRTVTSMTVVVLTFNSVKQAYERFLRS